MGMGLTPPTNKTLPMSQNEFSLTPKEMHRKSSIQSYRYEKVPDKHVDRFKGFAVIGPNERKRFRPIRKRFFGCRPILKPSSLDECSSAPYALPERDLCLT
jgi:hypothetical protein